MTGSTPIGTRTPEERLLRRTRTRLAAMTLALVATLLVAVGIVTYLAATRLMDANVGRAIDATLQAAIDDPEDHDDVGARRTPAGSDTFVLFLDGSGRVVGNPSRVGLSGLPDAAAVAAASAGGEDRRDGTYAGIPMRLVTRAVDLDDPIDNDHDRSDEASESGSGIAFVQVGFVLTLYRAQLDELAVAIMAAVVLGIMGAGVVTLLVTRRALAPIRAAFAAERRFIAAASHELRTPVAIIRASAEVIQREGHATPSGEPLVADIVAETDRLGRLVGDLLALASAEAGAVTIDAHPLDLGSWLVDTLRRAEPMVETRDLSLSTDTGPARGAVVMADADRLAQVLLILVDNAMAHSPPGGTIRVDAAREGALAVTIRVTDEGPGIPRTLRDSIFEPFARPPGARRTQGSGLGLAIARQLMTRQGGTLELADAPGHPDDRAGGACFVLRLPIASDHRVADGRQVPGPMAPG